MTCIFSAVPSGQSLLHCQRVADDRENLQERSRSDHCGKVLFCLDVTSPFFHAELNYA